MNELAQRETPNAMQLMQSGKISISQESGCWEWQGALNADGYGVYGASTPVGRLAHRVMYFLATGISPRGFDVHHKCKNRRCVNPDHVETLPKPVHARQDSVNGAKTHCIRGHAFEGQNLYSHPNGTRRCRICHADYERQQRAQRKQLCQTN